MKDLVDLVKDYLDENCWDGYRQVGMKKKNGKMVPNCVPNNEAVKQDKDIKDREGTQPAKYYAKDAEGDEMSKATKTARAKHFEKGAAKDDNDPSAYEPAPGDKEAKTKLSKHTIAVRKKFPHLYKEEAENSLKKKAEASGISASILKQVYDRGMAAWRTGHRPGTTPEQWGHARVNSFISKSKGTWGKADADLAAKVRKESFGEADEHSWRSEGHYTADGKEWKGDQHAYNGVVMTGKTHSKNSQKLYHYKELPAELRQKIDAKLGEATSWAQQAAIAIAKKKSGKYNKEGKKIDEEHCPHCEMKNEKHEKNCPMMKEEVNLIEQNFYRVGSEKYFDFFNGMRKQYQEGTYQPTGFDKELMEGDLGRVATLSDGQIVPLDCPMIEEEEDKKDVELGKPKAGGPKKYYVYVRDPSTGNIKKVTWGDTTGLKVKLNNPEARKSFAARHQCSTQKDRTTAAYWACNLPRYAKQLGLSGGGNFYW